VWGVRKQYLTSKNLLDTASVLCYTAAWADTEYTLFDSIHRSSADDMIAGVHALLDEADVVVTYNGNSFDLPMLNREFVKRKMAPPAPYKSVDVYRAVRSKFRFASNKMDDVLKELGYKGKSEHRGLMLWLDCMNGKKDAWEEMETYNVQDVTELENLYYHVLPWITNHPNHSLFDEKLCCPNCGSTHYQARGTRKLATGGIYHRYQCSAKGCGKWMRGNVRLNAGEKKKEAMISVQ
jgi:DNA polymerase elongation subunit (family B)